MKFEQCAERRGTNVKCKPVVKVLGEKAENYCAGHLKDPDVWKMLVLKEEDGA
jgi:hypothetical protein